MAAVGARRGTGRRLGGSPDRSLMVVPLTVEAAEAEDGAVRHRAAIAVMRSVSDLEPVLIGCRPNHF